MEDELIYFRELLDTDVTRLFEIYSNAEAMKYRETTPMKTIEDSYKMLERDKEKRILDMNFVLLLSKNLLKP